MVGWITNIIGLVYAIITTVLFVFPPELPVTADDMNYCIVAFGIVLIISTITWFVDGRKNYKGPQVETVPQETLTASSSYPEYEDPVTAHKAMDSKRL